MPLQTPYKDIMLLYREKVKPLVAEIESMSSTIPEHLVEDVSMAFDAIARSENPEEGEGQKAGHLSRARMAMEHCASLCYMHVARLRYRRIRTFLSRASDDFLKPWGKGMTHQEIMNALEEFKAVRSRCRTSPDATYDQQREDLDSYRRMCDVIAPAYGMVRSAETSLIISNTVRQRPVERWKQALIAIAAGIGVGVALNVVENLVEMFVNR